MTSSFELDRHWVPFGSNAAEGYSRDPKELQALEDVSCLVLLGVPGIGKTKELEKAAARARHKGRLVDFVSLGQLSEVTELEDRLLGGSNFRAWSDTGLAWVIFLDGLDEGLPQLPTLEPEIPRIFRQIGQRRQSLAGLHLRITCRLAEWPRSLEEQLKSIWPNSETQLFQLDDLNQEELRRAVGQMLTGDDARRFLTQVNERDALPLAVRPITLNMLLNIFQERSELPNLQVELYQRGLLASVEEANYLRRTKRRPGLLDNQSKLTICARIAAANLFSNKSEIWSGLQSDSIPSRAMILSEVAGGYEPSMGAAIPVGEIELHDATRSALFVIIGDQRFVWAHQTFAEFLAAYYLVAHGLTADEMLSLLRGSDGSRQVAAHLREVAAWLASMRADFFELLITTEPDILLRSDVAAATVELRALLVKELLRRFDNVEIHDFQPGSRSRYDQLDYPGLAEQLRPYISDKRKNIVARRAAIDIAEANKATHLAPILSEVALDLSDEIHIRAQAAAALSRIRDPENSIRLQPLATISQPEDLDDEIKGWALQAIWPEYLPVTELFESLTKPKNDSLIGAYWLFLTSIRLPSLTPAEALAALRWLTKVLGMPDEYSSFFQRIIPQLLVRVWEQTRDKDVREQFATFYTKLFRTGEYLSLGEELKTFQKSYLASTEGDRRAFVEAILETVISPTGIDKLAMYALTQPVRLVAGIDLTWLSEIILTKFQDTPKESLIDLIVSLTFGRDINDLMPVWDASAKIPGLEHALERAYSIELSSQVARWQKRDFYRQQEDENEAVRETEDTLSSITAKLAEIEAGDSYQWWVLNQLFFARTGRTRLPSEFNGNLARCPAWELLSIEMRDRVVTAALRYIKENRIPSHWLGKNTFYRPAAAGYRAFRLLLSERPHSLTGMTSETWAKWAPTLIGVQMNEDREELDAREKIIHECYNRAQIRSLRTIALVIGRGEASVSVDSFLSKLSSCFDMALGLLLSKMLERFSMGDARSISIIKFLSEKNFEPFIDVIKRHLRAEPPSFDSQIKDEGELVAGAAVLLDHRAISTWPLVRELYSRNTKRFRSVIEGVARSAFWKSTPFYVELTEADVAELIVLLFDLYPDEDRDPGRRGRAGFLSELDHVEQLRSGALRHLVSRGTPAAVDAVERIAKSVPNQDWLKWQLVDARKELSSKGWQDWKPRQIIGFITGLRPISRIRSRKEVFTGAAENVIAEDVPKAQLPDLADLSSHESIELPRTLQPVSPILRSFRILVVATEWGSAHGGLSTLNRNLCIALAGLGHEVACVVIDPSQRDIEEARASRIRLVEPPRVVTFNSEARLILYTASSAAGFVPEIVIGHDRITGPAAYHVAKDEATVRRRKLQKKLLFKRASARAPN
jgi:hypothetical protein